MPNSLGQETQSFRFCLVLSEKKKKYIVNSYYKAITKLDVQLILWVHTWTVIEIAISQLGTAGKTVGNHIKIWSGKRCSMGRKSRVRKESCNKFFFFCFVNTPSYTVSKRSSLWSVERFYYSYKIIATTTAAWKLLKKKNLIKECIVQKVRGSGWEIFCQWINAGNLMISVFLGNRLSPIQHQAIVTFLSHL